MHISIQIILKFNSVKHRLDVEQAFAIIIRLSSIVLGVKYKREEPTAAEYTVKLSKWRLKR